MNKSDLIMNGFGSFRCLQLSKFYPPVKGGIEAVAFELTEGLSRLGFAMQVLCANTVALTSEEKWPYPVVRASSWCKLLSTSISPAIIFRLLRQRRYHDVIHVHLPDPMANLAIYISRPTAKLIIHWHSDVINQKFALRLYAPLQKWLLRRADLIVATSESYAKSSPWLQEFMAKVRVVPIGIRRPDVDVDLGNIWRDRYPGKRIVFSLGRMVYYKGFDVLIDAALDLPDDVVVLIGGGGELLERHRARVKGLGMSHKIQFLGRLDDFSVSALMSICDLFCLPSIVRAEAFGVVLLEAMAAGRPIVATNIEGSGVAWVNLHGVTGYNVPVANPKEMANAMSSILGDSGLASQFSQAALARYNNYFTAEKMVNATAQLYVSVSRSPLL